MNGYEGWADERLLLAYYAGDDGAFAELYRRYSPVLVNYLRWFVPREDAEDLSEEIFLRVVRTRVTGSGRFRPDGGATPRTWLFTIARNCRSDLWRGRGLVKPEADPEQQPDDRPTPGDGLEAVEFWQAVFDCLVRLPGRQRAVLLLRLLGFPNGEIATALGTSEGRVGGRFHEAHDRMRQCLRHRGYAFIPPGITLPPDTPIVMAFPDELLVCLARAALERRGYRFVPPGCVPPGARVVLIFPEEWLVMMGGNPQEDTRE
jgi:RNA polymerase sigma-70 factor (ECF subfamily)